MSPLQIELLKGAFTLASVALGAGIALFVYFRQKEYELTKQRYLEQGIDIVASQLEIALGVVSHNYARSLQLCKLFRDSGSQLELKELERGFLEFDSSKFQQVAHHRVGSLLRDQIVWETFQFAMAHATTANQVIVQEIPEAIKRFLEDPERFSDREKLSRAMVRDLQETHDKGFKYSNLSHALHVFTLLLEEKPLSLKAIATFSKRPEVASQIARLRTLISLKEESGAEAV